MPSKRTPSNPRTPDRRTPNKAEPIPKRSIDIDDAAIDESAVVEPDEELDELANLDDDSGPNAPASPRKGAWRERDANRRAHGEDDLKA